MKKQIVAALAVLMTGCDGSSQSPAASTNIAGSRQNEAGGFCVEYTGADYQSARVEKTCTSQKNAFIAGACPAGGRVGTCVVYKGKRSEASYRYYSGFPGYGITPKEGVVVASQDQCGKLKGAWISE